MAAISAAWARIANLPHRVAVAATVAAMAIAVGVGFAFAVNGLREPSVTVPAASAVASLAAVRDDSPSPTATSTPSPTPSPTPHPTPSPTSHPTPSPTARPTPAPVATPIPTPPPAPMPTPQPAPTSEWCDTFSFLPSPTISVDSLVELQEGIVGTWVGCLTTPWVPRYQVTITFRADGTYSSVAEEAVIHPALYYGTDDDSPEKVYELNDLQDDLEGIGQIDIVFWEGNTNRGELRNIRLTGDELEFEFFHRGEYGPLLFQLYRAAPSN